MSTFWTSWQHFGLQLALLAFAATLAALKVISGGEALAFAGPLVGVGVGGAVASAATTAANATPTDPVPVRGPVA